LVECVYVEIIIIGLLVVLIHHVICVGIPRFYKFLDLELIFKATPV